MAPDPPVAHILRLIDDALRPPGPHRLADGHVFVLDNEASAPAYHRFVLANPRPPQPASWFEVATAGTSSYLDRSAESPGWSYA